MMIFAVMQKGEPMSRLIDADALINDLEKWMKQVDPTHPQEDNAIPPLDDIIASTLMTIDEQPTIESEPKWIPCVDGNEPKANVECWISTSAKYVRRASYAPKADNQPNGFIVTDGGFGFYEYGKSAKAWMPYTKEPEPYREEGEEDD